MSSDRMAVAFASGKIIIREVKAISSNTCTSIDKLIIPCPENLREELDADLEEMDTDGPSLCSSRNGKFLIRAVCDSLSGLRHELWSYSLIFSCRM